MKTIGIVAEGPRDFEVIAAVIDTITNEENSYQMIQPEPDMAGRFGNGWKGVWKWCETNQGSLNTYMNSLTPVLDFLVIHMDGDVERCEKEVHCECQRKFCDAPESAHPLTCEKIANNRSDCPVILPCEEHENTPEAGADFLRTFINALLRPEDELAVSYRFISEGTPQMTGTGGLRRLTKDFVLNYPVSLPPLDEQRKIVNQTEEEIAVVEQNKRLIEIFEKKINDKISEVWGE